MKNYKHIFFDLDHTLWDFETNSRETLVELFALHRLSDLGIKLEDFMRTYLEVNEFMWEQYRMRQIDKEILRTKRFNFTLERFGISNIEKISQQLADDYISRSPYKTNLFPGAWELLKSLSKEFRLHIITNGFPEVQHKKMKSTNITEFFDNVFISEEIGFHKPEKELFLFALDRTNATAESSLMIGDNMETDIIGAMQVGIDAAWFNPKAQSHPVKPTFEIQQLPELADILGI